MPDDKVARRRGSPPDAATETTGRATGNGTGHHDGMDVTPDLELTVEQLSMGDRRSRLRVPTGDTARALSLGVACLLIVMVVAVVVHAIAGAAASAGVNGATSQAGVGRTQGGPTPLPTIPLGTGWSSAGPAGAQTIAFMRPPGAAATAYTCGTVDGAAARQPTAIGVDVSYDGGRAWQRRAGAVSGLACAVSVDPTNPQDVVLATTPHALFGINPPVDLYRSFDGGGTWSPLAVPLPPDTAQHVTTYSWAWAGSAFFFAPFIVQGTGNWTRLAVSVAGGPLMWVDQNGLFERGPADVSIARLVGTFTGLFVVLSRGAQCAQDCFPIMQSSDLGQSWAPFRPTYGGAPIELAPGASGEDGVTLFGTAVASGAQAVTYLRSTDGGITWAPLPVLPASYAAFRLVQAPDGTLYAAISNCCGGPGNVAPGIYRLPAGGARWSFVGAMPGDGADLLELATGDSGHPVALWGGAHRPSPDQVLPGLETHAP